MKTNKIYLTSISTHKNTGTNIYLDLYIYDDHLINLYMSCNLMTLKPARDSQFVAQTLQLKRHMTCAPAAASWLLF